MIRVIERLPDDVYLEAQLTYSNVDMAEDYLSTNNKLFLVSDNPDDFKELIDKSDYINPEDGKIFLKINNDYYCYVEHKDDKTSIGSIEFIAECLISPNTIRKMKNISLVKGHHHRLIFCENGKRMPWFERNNDLPYRHEVTIQFPIQVSYKLMKMFERYSNDRFEEHCGGSFYPDTGVICIRSLGYGIMYSELLHFTDEAKAALMDRVPANFRLNANSVIELEE